MKNGTREAMTMWFGLLTGFAIAALIGAMVTHLVGSMMDRYVVWLKYIGCAYILYLAWQIYRSTGEAKESDSTCTFLSGMIVQLTNAKIILFDLMAYTTFVLPYSNRLSDLLVVTALLEIAGPGANLVYLFAGGELHNFFNRYPRQIDTVMALLLAACAVYILLS
jgi:cysteine/O-acetylserine efflux protein